MSYYAVQNPILKFKLGRNSILTFEIGPNTVSWHSKSYFDIGTKAECRIYTFTILFWHSKLGQISYFYIQNPIFDIRTEAEFRILTFTILFWHSNVNEYCILTFKILFWHSKSGRISYFDIKNTILTFKLRGYIVFWHSKSYVDIQNWAECSISSFKLL